MTMWWVLGMHRGRGKETSRGWNRRASAGLQSGARSACDSSVKGLDHSRQTE